MSWYNDLGGLLAHDIDTVIECLTLYIICSKFNFMSENTVVLFEQRKIFESNLITKQNPFRPTNGATRCVADVPPIENNRDYGGPYPCNRLS